MSVTDKFASAVASRYADESGDRQAAIDPATLDAILAIIASLAPLVEKCIDAWAAKRAAANPNLFQRAAVRRAVVNAIGRQGFREVNHMVDAVLDAGAAADVKDIQAILKENR